MRGTLHASPVPMLFRPAPLCRGFIATLEVEPEPGPAAEPEAAPANDEAGGAEPAAAPMSPTGFQAAASAPQPSSSAAVDGCGHTGAAADGNKAAVPGESLPGQPSQGEAPLVLVVAVRQGIKEGFDALNPWCLEIGFGGLCVVF